MGSCGVRWAKVFEFYTEDGSNRFPQYSVDHLSDYTASHKLRRQA
jgi:hypothetical protein